MIERRSHDGVAILEFRHRSANPLNLEFLDQIRRSVREALEGQPRGLVLTSEGPIFCAGLDLPALLEYDREQLRRLLREFEACCVEIFSCPVPTVAAINGHAIAGGAILTLACDRRHAVMGQSKWGLNEAQLGLAVPGFAVELMRYALSRPTVEKLLYSGTLYPAFKAHDMGAIDVLVEADDLESAALQSIEEWSASPAAFADIKRRLHAPVLQAIADHSGDHEEEWIEQRFSPEVRARLEQAVRGLREKNEEPES